VDAAHQMLQRFNFIPHARLDDLMVSWASPGGGVGPHLDSYDVFLIQVQGQRRWQIGRVADTSFVPDAPLKLLRHFEPEEEWVLDPGDMLYLPPLWAHDGVAVGGDCMTCSVGFRAPGEEELARDLLQRLADEELDVERLYRDPRQSATHAPGAVPDSLLAFARRAVQRRLDDPLWLQRALGEALSEPKPQVWFPQTGAGAVAGSAGVRLSARTRMLHDDRHVFINGEAFAAQARQAGLEFHCLQIRWSVLADHRLALVKRQTSGQRDQAGLELIQARIQAKDSVLGLLHVNQCVLRYALNALQILFDPAERGLDAVKFAVDDRELLDDHRGEPCDRFHHGPRVVLAAA